MTDITTVRHIGHIVLVVSAILTTLFPLLYALVPWYQSFLGRAVMFRGVALAIVLDLAVVFTFWIHPRATVVLLWINIGIIAVIGLSSAAMCLVMIRLRFERRYERDSGESGV